ncbi:MAG: 2-oxoacid:acceptor oxidoreductase subunit alpha [Deltaproteobacteria bacterium]|nr:2-oxoacid:acceptor oxidoreductase subunit alpha [Deltaproteobacteria bacterium]
MRDIVIGMAGSGGDGIVSAGESLIAAAASLGFHAMMTKSFGPQIRGGESSCRVRLSTRELHSSGGALGVAIALNWEDFLKFGSELRCDDATVVIYEAKTGVLPEHIPLGNIKPREIMAVPLAELTKQSAGTEKAKNSLVLGLLSGWLGLSQDTLRKGIQRRYGKKGEEIVNGNLRAFEAGRQYADAHPSQTPLRLDAPAAATTKILTDGNDITAAAAIFAGCQFFGGYPITPSSEVMQFLGKEIWKYGGAVLQAEDEIAGIGTAVGASFGGKKAMTATSGPGMSLKTEILGLATIAELPLVVVNVQRGGPSTGLPTKPEQSDLYQACFSAHGDVLRPVLAPTSVADSFHCTVDAFNIAERYQTPVIILSDQEIAQRKETCDPIDTSKLVVEDRKRPTPEQLEKYTRFAASPDGISPISHPGMKGGAYLAAGIEHTESGAPSASGAVHARMNDKRFNKLLPLESWSGAVTVAGDAGADLALIAWGSIGGVALEVLDLAQAEGLRLKVLVPRLLYPVPKEVYRSFLRNVNSGLVVEQSHQGQLYKILRMELDLPKGLVSYCRSGANPIQPSEVLAKLKALSADARRSLS